MRINSLDTRERILVIAEIGNNHEGDMGAARELVRRAADCGAGAVKFQTFRTELFVSPRDEARFHRMKSFELNQCQLIELSELAKSVGLLFVSTPLDLASAELLEPLVDCFKIASGDINFYPLIRRVALTGKPLIISSGASELPQLRDTVARIEHDWTSNCMDGQLGLLHCVSNYPVAPEDANLQAIANLHEDFDCSVGYSDHTIGINACLLAVALGATIIEKHFTLDKNYSDFRDHQLSSDPAELAELVRGIETTVQMLGDGVKTVKENERDIVPMIRRSIVTSRALPAGYQLTENDLMWLRPANGLPPGQEDQVIGKRLLRELGAGEPIRLADVA